jgi:uncharacterized protein (TIGR03083 family)
MTPDQHFSQLGANITLFRRLLSAGDLTEPVPGCPGWDLADLSGHLGGIYRFAATAIAEARGIDEPSGPRERADLLGWFDTGATQVQDALDVRDWRRPCWTMAPPANTGFWARRMCHETALHLWDAQQSQGTEGVIDAELAADGVQEVVAMFFPRQVRLQRILPLTGTLEIHIQDAPAGDHLILAGDGAGPAPDESDAVLSGQAQALLLLLWKRVPFSTSEFTLSGDQDTARRALATALTP